MGPGLIFGEIVRFDLSWTQDLVAYAVLPSTRRANLPSEKFVPRRVMKWSRVQAIMYVIDLSSLVYIRTAGFDLSSSTLIHASCRSTQ